MLSDRCPLSLFLLSATLVICGQTVGWIKMPLGHIVSDGDSALRTDSSRAAPNFRGLQTQDLLWPNGCMDQDTTWYGGS